MQIPKQGSSLDDVMARLKALQVDDADYHNARTWGLIYNAGPEVDAMVQAAASDVILENALNPFAFPSLRQMQQDVVAMTGHMLHGGDEVTGAMSSGGTESIFLAVKTARDRVRAEKGIAKGRLVIPRTAHPAFVKAAHLLDLDLVYMPLGEDLRTRAADLEPLLTDDTVLCVASAPAYPHGMVDPIEEMAAVAQSRGVGLHVDACLGGFMLPWLERLGYDIPPWDFRVPGVVSMSADVHKYGYAIKGASVVLHRPKANVRYQIFIYTDWPGGLYGTQGFLGTKPAAPIAAAWAVLHFLGEEGYLRLAAETMDAAKRLIAGVNAMPDAHIWGEPDMSVVAIGSRVHDILAVGDTLNDRNWHFDRQENPAALHLMASPRHKLNVDEFLADLRYALDNHAEKSTRAATYGDDVSEQANAR